MLSDSLKERIKGVLNGSIQFKSAYKMCSNCSEKLGDCSLTRTRILVKICCRAAEASFAAWKQN